MELSSLLEPQKEEDSGHEAPRTRKMKQLKVNILGGRDVGKTTIAAHAFAELTWLGIDVVLQTLCHAYETEPNVSMEVIPAPGPLSPHEAAELCKDALNFLVLRRADYNVPSKGRDMVWLEGADKKLEKTLREGRVRYKSLPGVRASVLYVVKKISDAVGYGK